MRACWVLLAFGALADMEVDYADKSDAEAEEAMSAEDLDEMYEELDTNKDGKLLESEVWSSLQEEIGEEEESNTELTTKLKQMLSDADKDKDGHITKPELASFVQAAESVLDEMDESGLEGDEEDEEHASSFLEEDAEDEEYDE